MPKQKFGQAFSNHLNKTTYKFGHFHRHKNSGNEWQEHVMVGSDDEYDQTKTLSPWRKLSLSVVLLIILSGLFLRLFHLQVVEGQINRELADSNRIQIKVIHAPRGVIYDRNAKVLANNNPGWRLIDPDHPAKKPTFVSREEALQWEVANDPRFKNLEIDSIRSYPMGRATSHILGYVSELTEDEIKDPDYTNYKTGDKIGRGGIEESYEKVLKGKDGGEVYEVDAQGKKGRVLRKVDAIPGQNIYLTIDADIQKVGFNQLEQGIKKAGSCCGALVAQDPKDGQIYALVSYPSFDPVDLSTSLSEPNSPFLNRVIGGSYPPGSTFKIASSLAGLSTGKITATTQFEDTGVMHLGPFSFANWYFSEYGKTEGQVDIVKAIKRSNDIYFYNLGQIIGEKALGDTAKKIGFGQKLGIDIPGEVDGLIPDNDWKVKTFDEVWYPGDTLHMAIGQGFVLATPLQINNLISMVAANGKQFPPYLALKITDYKNNLVKVYKYDALNSEKFKPADLNLVRTGLEQVPQNGGTAWPFFTFPIKSAGKTGTAEFGDPKNEHSSIGRYNTHAWYTAYAPALNPQISATVLIEAGGEGSTASSPVVKELFRYYFSPDKNNLIKDVNIIATDSAKTLGE